MESFVQMGGKRKVDHEDEGGRVKEARMEKEEEEDHRQNLPDDCWLEVFRHLNHDNLDVCAQVSKQFNELVKVSRKKAVKTDALELHIHQSVGTIYIYVNFDDTEAGGLKKYRLLLNEDHPSGTEKFKEVRYSTILCNRSGTETPSQLSSMQAFLDRASKLLCRFVFTKVKIDMLQISKDMLSLIKKISISPRSISLNSSLEINTAEIDEDNDARKELRSYLINTDTSRLEVGICSIEETNFIDAEFLKAYSRSVILPSLVFEQRLTRNPQRQLADPNFTHILPDFGSYEMHHLIINVDGLVKAILKRLLRKKEGVWKFFISREIQRREVEMELNAEMEMTWETERDVALKSLPNEVTIDTEERRWGGTYLIAKFY